MNIKIVSGFQHCRPAETFPHCITNVSVERFALDNLFLPYALFVVSLLNVIMSALFVRFIIGLNVVC